MAKFILKDWYGKNCEFDNDKIFVQDVNGELVQFTQGRGNPILETLEVTENGTYTPSEGVDGFGSVEVNVKDEGNVFLLSNFEITGFAEDSKYSAYSKNLTFGTDLDYFGISIGKEYTVGWDDELYTVYGKDTYQIIEEVVGEGDSAYTVYYSIFYLGNGSLLGIDGSEDSGEPFAILWTQSKDLTIVTTDTAESHVLGLIKRSRPQEIVDMLSENIIITENGEYTPNEIYDGFGRVVVEVPTPEITLQDKTITENGTFTADEGFDGLGQVIVNVMSNTDNNSLKAKITTCSLTGSLNQLVSIDFGFVPDLLIIYPSSGIATNSSKYMFIFGISQKLADSLGIGKFIDIFGVGSKTFYKNSSSDMQSTESNAYLWNVNESGFKTGNNYNYSAGTYKVFALGL